MMKPLYSLFDDSPPFTSELGSNASVSAHWKVAFQNLLSDEKKEIIQKQLKQLEAITLHLGMLIYKLKSVDIGQIEELYKINMGMLFDKINARELSVKMLITSYLKRLEVSKQPPNPKNQLSDLLSTMKRQLKTKTDDSIGLMENIEQLEKSAEVLIDEISKLSDKPAPPPRPPRKAPFQNATLDSLTKPAAPGDTLNPALSPIDLLEQIHKCSPQNRFMSLHGNYYKLSMLISDTINQLKHQLSQAEILTVRTSIFNKIVSKLKSMNDSCQNDNESRESTQLFPKNLNDVKELFLTEEWYQAIKKALDNYVGKQPVSKDTDSSNNLKKLVKKCSFDASHEQAVASKITDTLWHALEMQYQTALEYKAELRLQNSTGSTCMR